MIDCISMWQPWATWVEKEWKKTETRRHKRLACLARRRKRIVIHAADKWDPDWREKAELFLSPDQSIETQDAQRGDLWPRKALICTVFPKEHRQLIWSDSQDALCECSFNDLYGLVLQDVLRFDPITWSGHQGLMKIPDGVVPEKSKLPVDVCESCDGTIICEECVFGV